MIEMLNDEKMWRIYNKNIDKYASDYGKIIDLANESLTDEHVKLVFSYIFSRPNYFANPWDELLGYHNNNMLNLIHLRL